MNKQKIGIFASVTILILLMSVSTVSAGDIFGKITPTTETTKVRCGYGWCTPTVGDIDVDGGALPTLPSPGKRVYVYVNVRNTFKHSVTDVATVTVSGLEGQPIYQEQTYIFRLKANGVKNHVFEVDTKELPKGDYNVMITFPIQDGEKNKENNIYETAFRIVPKNIKCTGISKIYNYANEEWRSGDDDICGTSDDDRSNVKYTQNCNAGNGKESDYLDFTTKCTPLPFDVTVKGVSNNIITPPQTLDILVTVAHDSEKTIKGKITVSISGAYPEKAGDFVYSLNTYKNTKDVVMKHYDTVISDESTHVFFDTMNWNPGIYHVIISFPIQKGETDTTNNIYEYDIKILPKSKSDVDLSLDKFVVYPDYWCVGLSCVQRIIRTDQFLVDYTISNKGTQNASGTLFISTEGVTLRTIVFKRVGGETRSETIAVNAYNLPSHATAWNYQIIGKVDSVSDTNVGNNIKNVFYLFRAT